MQKVLEGKSPVNFPVPEKIKFATVDVQTGYLANEFSLEILQVAVKEDLDLSVPPALPEEQEPNETELLPDPEPVKRPQDSLNPEKRNAVSDP
jgi:membrane carboxypeptidase/penicillin-binding protein